jgi:hypothetical protein
MHFLRNLSLLLLSSIFWIHLSSPHHVVFEEIGKMAGGLSYIDAIVPINISGLVQAVHNFHHDIVCLQKVYQECRQPGGVHDKWFHMRLINLLDLSLADANSMLANLESLRDSLPPVAADSHLPLHAAHEYRVKRVSPFAIIRGVIGMLMAGSSSNV